MNNENKERYVKLTNKECIHNGFEYKEGLNIDIHPFNDNYVCKRGGLYFCRYKDLSLWHSYNHMNMYWIWDVSLPENEKVIDMGDKLKAHCIILSNKRCIWDDYDICLKIVKHVPWRFRDINTKLQSDEICKIALKYDANALQYIKDQKPWHCLIAIKKNAAMLDYVKNQTYEICLEAVKVNGIALYYINDKKYQESKEIKYTAIKTSPLALAYVINQTEDLCMMAVEKNGLALEYVHNQTREICIAAVNQNPYALQFVEKQTREICIIAVSSDINVIQYIHDEYYDEMYNEFIKGKYDPDPYPENIYEDDSFHLLYKDSYREDI